MRVRTLVLSTVPLAMLAACNQAGSGDANSSTPGQPAEAQKKAGDQTIAAGLDRNGRFAQAAKAAGLDGTLAGPGPYTVLVPSDEAFGKLPEGRFDDLTQQENRAELTRVLTYHILPGTVLVEDIGRAIENSDGNAVLATMGGETLSAARDGDAIVLSDSAGGKAHIVQPDARRTNGVVHVIDTVLIPPEVAGQAAQEPAAQ